MGDRRSPTKRHDKGGGGNNQGCGSGGKATGGKAPISSGGQRYGSTLGRGTEHAKGGIGDLAFGSFPSAALPCRVDSAHEMGASGGHAEQIFGFGTAAHAAGVGSQSVKLSCEKEVNGMANAAFKTADEFLRRSAQNSGPHVANASSKCTDPHGGCRRDRAPYKGTEDLQPQDNTVNMESNFNGEGEDMEGCFMLDPNAASRNMCGLQKEADTAMEETTETAQRPQGVRQNAATEFLASVPEPDNTQCSPPARPNASSCYPASFYYMNREHGPDDVQGSNAWRRPEHVRVNWTVPSSTEQPFSLNREAIRDNQRKLEMGLVGKLIGKRLPFAILLNELRKKWSQFGNFQLLMLSADCFMCLFDSAEARDSILMGGPWFIAGKGLDKWTDVFSPNSLQGLTAPVWIRFPQLPLLYWDNDNLARIASLIGTPLWIDAFTSSWGRNAYARVCIRLDLSKRLPKGVLVPGIHGNFFQPVEYEGIPALCFKCGYLGHKEIVCQASKERSGKPSNPVGANASNVSDTTNSKPTSFATDVEPSIALGYPKVSTTNDIGESSHSGGNTEPNEGQWTLVSRRKNKAKFKPPRPPSTTTQPEMAKGEQPGCSNVPTETHVTLGSETAQPNCVSDHLRPDGQCKLLFPAAQPILEGSLSVKAQTSKARISKAHFDKELLNLGPIVPTPRKRKKKTQDEDPLEFHA